MACLLPSDKTTKVYVPVRFEGLPYVNASLRVSIFSTFGASVLASVLASASGVPFLVSGLGAAV
jgi:hypothetical protein